jgi:hypothetical protein
MNMINSGMWNYVDLERGNSAAGFLFEIFGGQSIPRQHDK